MGIAYFSYRRYYPRLRSPKCHEPFPSRGMDFNSSVEQNKDDDEEAGGAGLFELDDSDEAA
jgi:diacylglycerol diphosphate phosphatase/phosphatidate phosphatase